MYCRVPKVLKGKRYPGKIVSYKKPLYLINFDDGDREDWEGEETQANIDEKKKPCDCNACKFPHYFCHQLQQQISMETTKLLDDENNNPMHEIL